MLFTPSSRKLATALQREAGQVANYVHRWFEEALAKSSGEVPFVRELVAASNGDSLTLGNVAINVSSAMLHQKPYVVFEMNGERERCELADLLVVVTYQKDAGVVERKSILYQAKVQYAKNEYEEGSWEIQKNQQYCLAQFPEMWPSHSRCGPKPANTWNVSPRTLDLGCYLLLTRDKTRFSWRRSLHPLFYVLAPSATALTSMAGGKWRDGGYSYDGTNRFVNHVLFESGEPHSSEVDRFIDGVIAAAGGAALHPPTTCHITKVYDGDGRPDFSVAKEAGGFGIIRITVSSVVDNES